MIAGSGRASSQESPGPLPSRQHGAASDAIHTINLHTIMSDMGHEFQQWWFLLAREWQRRITLEAEDA